MAEENIEDPLENKRISDPQEGLRVHINHLTSMLEENKKYFKVEFPELDINEDEIIDNESYKFIKNERTELKEEIAKLEKEMSIKKSDIKMPEGFKLN